MLFLLAIPMGILFGFQSHFATHLDARGALLVAAVMVALTGLTGVSLYYFGLGALKKRRASASKPN
jgi:drug/metabolite transporter (DMT)-like permease